MQDLVGVDVADAGDHVLVEQQRLRAPGRWTRVIRRSVRRRERFGDRIDAQHRQLGQLDRHVVGIEHDDLTERARVDEPAPRRPSSRVITTCVCGRPRRAPAASSTWPLMRRWIITASPRVEREQQVLAPTVGSLDHRVGQPADQRARATCAGRHAPDRPRRGRSDARRDARQATPNRLDLGQFRHADVRPVDAERQALVGGHLFGGLLRATRRLRRGPHRRRSPTRRTSWRGPGPCEVTVYSGAPRPARGGQLLQLRLVVELIEALDRRRESGRDEPIDHRVRRPPHHHRGRRLRAPLRTRRTGSTASRRRPPRPHRGRAGCTAPRSILVATSASANALTTLLRRSVS